MKRNYESPKMFAELFVANQYCKGCGLTTSVIPATTVRCQSNGHYNSANDTIFLEGTTGCTGIYNPNIKNDNCHPVFGVNSHGATTSGTGYFKGSWSTKESSDGQLTAQWFTPSSSGNDTAYRGFFQQGGHYHAFYVSEEQATTMNLS